MLVPLYGTIYPYLLKTTVLNTFKHNLKKTISWQFSWKLGLVGLFLVFTYIFYPFVYGLIGPSIYLFTYFFLFHSFSRLFSTFILPILPFSLPCYTIYFLLFIIYPFRYLIMFLTCSSLCYNIIIYLIFLYLLHINQSFFLIASLFN